MAAGDTIAKLFVELGFKGDGLKKGTKSATQDLNKLNNGLKSIDKMVRKTVAVGFTVAAGAMAAFGVSAAKAGAKFEQSMTMVGILSGQTGDSLASMEDKARALGRTTAFTATQAAEGMQALARAGLSANEVISATGPALHFAGANASSMQQSTKLLAATMAQFNLSALESERIVDTFSAAINNSLLDTTSLAEAMKYAGTTGAAFGMTLEDTTAAVAMFRNLGLEGSQAGTNFRMSMIQAARATERKKAVLQKYGLAMRDINPELNTFAEIMDTIGKSAMGTSDAIEIFGARAGANVAMLSSEISNNSDRWQQVNDAISTSAGLTENNYVAMMDTVVGQWDILKSVVQDMQLELFEGFGDGLKELLMALQELIVFTTQFMTEGTSTISADWNNAMLGMAASIRSNKASIATTIVQLVETFTMLGQKVLWLIKNFRTLASILVSIWVAGKVIAFIGFIHTLTAAMITATGATTGLAVAVNAATGGMVALIAAVGAGIAVFFKLKGSHEESSGAAEHLARVQKDLAIALDESKKATIDLFDAQDQGADAGLHEMEMKLKANDELTHVMRREIELVRSMDAATKARHFAEGKLVETMINGERVLVSTGMAMRMAAKEGGTYSKQMDKAVLGTAKAHELAKKTADESLRSAKRLNGMYESARAVVVRLGGSLDDAKATTQLLGQFGMDEWELKIGLVDTTAYTVAVKEAETNAKAAADSINAYFKALEAVRAAMEREAQAKRISLDEEEAAERRKIWKKLQEDRLKASKRTDDLLRASVIERLESEEKYVVVFKMKLEDRLKAIDAAFDEELALYRGNAIKIEEIERNRDYTIKNTRRAVGEEAAKDLNDLNESRREEMKAGLRTEVQALEAAHEEEWKSAADLVKKSVAAHEMGSLDRINAVKKTTALLTALEETHTKEVIDLRRRLTLEYTQNIDDEIIAIHQAKMPEYLALQSKQDGEILAMQSEVMEEIEKLTSKHIMQRVALHQTLTDEVNTLLKSELSDEEKLRQDLKDHLLRIPVEMGEERLALEAYYLRKISELNEEALAERQAGWTKFQKWMFKTAVSYINQTKLSLQGGAEVFSEIAKSIKNSGIAEALRNTFAVQTLKKWVADAKQRFAQLKFDFADAVKSIKEKWGGFLEQHQGLAKFVDAVKGMGAAIAGIFGPLFKRFIDKAKLSMGVSAVVLGGIVVGLQGVVKTAQMASAAFGKVLDGLAAISGFQFSLIDGVTEVTKLMQDRADAEAALASGEMTSSEYLDAIADLPETAGEAATTFVTEMVSGAILMVRTFVQSAPVFMAELAAQVPLLLQEIVNGLPSIILSIVNGIEPLLNAVTEFIPQAARLAAEQIPMMVQTIISFIPQIIGALIAEIPQLLSALTQIVVMLVEVVPLMITELVAAIPSILIELVSMINQVIVALVAAIPTILQGIIQALPVIIDTLLQGALSIITMIILQWPTLVASIIDLIPQLLEAVYVLIPTLINTVIESLPLIVEAIISALPLVTTAVIKAIPQIIMLVIHNIPLIVEALIFELVPALLSAVVQLVGEAVRLLFRFFKDLISEIVSLGIRKTETFGDTPGVIQAGMSGMTAGFEPGDYIVAAKKKEDLLAQIMDSMAGGMGRAMNKMSAPQMTMPAVSGIGPAVMQTSQASAGDSMPLRVTVTAEGKTLDDVLYIAGARGKTPKLQKELRKASGATLGFSRGRFASSS